MTIYYVRPTVGNNANTGLDWASNSWATLKYACDTVTAGDHTIVMDTANADVYTTNQTFTLAAGVKIVSSSDGSTYTAGATVNSTTSGIDFVLTGGAKCAIFGLTMKAATAGVSSLNIQSTDSGELYCEDCSFGIPTTSGTSLTIGPGTGSTINTLLRTRNCSWTFGSVSNSMPVTCSWISINDTFAATGSVPTTLLSLTERSRGEVWFIGGDFSAISGTLVGSAGLSHGVAHFVCCKLHASVTPLASTTTPGAPEVFFHDCSYDNAGTLTGYLFYHENWLGSTTISTAIYATTTGAAYDGTNRCSWVVDGKTSADYATPYESPWIDVYHSGTSAITPSLEVVRSGSATAYTNEQVWAEFLTKETANVAKYTLNYSDRRGPLSAAANQTTGALGAGDWTGENATSWFGKLTPSSTITPAEVAHLRTRICVAGDYTVYVDPQIRSLS